MFQQKYIDLIKNKFKAYLTPNKLVKVSNLHLYLNNEEIMQLYDYLNTLECFSLMDKNDALKQFIRLILNDIVDFAYCKICGKNLGVGYTLQKRSYCSIECKAKDKDIWLEKSKQTCKEKYGVQWSFQSENNKEKSKVTLLKHYGYDNIYEVDEIIAKRKETCLKRYNSEYYAGSTDIKEKRMKTCKEKYGVECILSSPDIRKKIEQTCLQNFGYTTILKSPEFRKQIENFYMKKYNVKNPNQVDVIKRNAKIKRCKKKYDQVIINNVFKPLFAKDSIGIIEKYLWKCNVCGHVFQHSFFNGRFRLRCLKCNPKNNGISLQQLEVINFVKSLNVKIKKHDRTLIRPYELDIVIPAKKLAIEFNGSFYHSQNSSLRQIDKQYHLMKTEMCNAAQYSLLHIYECYWLNNKEYIKNLICSKLNVNMQHINLQKCIIKLIQRPTTFLTTYSLKNSVGNIYVGIYLNDGLIGVLIFKQIQNKNFEFIDIVIRFGYIIDGDIFKYFENIFNPRSIISYIDRSYNDNYLQQFGFKIVDKTDVDYFYTDNKQIFKHVDTILIKNRCYKIYNSGYLVVKKQYKS